MSSSGGTGIAVGGRTRLGKVMAPYLDKIVKNAAWRKHSQMVASCKSALDHLESLTSDPDLSTPLPPDSELLLTPLILALDSSYPKVADPALECLYRLFSLGFLRGPVDSPTSILARILDSVFKVSGISDEAVELAVLRVLLSAVRSPAVLIRGEYLVNVVRACYNVYLGGFNGTNQICAKAVLAQMVFIVFKRAEDNSLDIVNTIVSVGDLLEFSDKNLNEGSSIHFSNSFLHDVVAASEALPDLNLLSLPNDAAHDVSEDNQNDSNNSDSESNIREDAFLLFRNLCKLSMKFSSQDNFDDQILLRGKILSLELLKVVLENAGITWRTHDRFLNALKQYLCLSLLKNSALSVMAVFQLQCSIFMILLSKLRSALKEEIGIFFPMLVLRILENVNQPSFLQKMTVLNFLEKIALDPLTCIDIFVNYDCDVDAPNLFERTVNGLLKTALGPSPGSTTSLSPAQDLTFRHESVKCLVCIIKSMGLWMDQQLKLEDSFTSKNSDVNNKAETPSATSAEDGGSIAEYDFHSEIIAEMSDAASLEQRRAYKIELQKGVSIFNRKPSKGVQFLVDSKKVGRSPEEIAAFLKHTAGLSESMIGDYLGERDEFCIKVMHAYVDSFNFQNMDFGEAIRFFLRGFRLPGEAQKIDRIMEKFAERYCKCNPDSFSSADTAYVLAYSVIMLNTDAHNSMVKDKMTKADFIRNNRGINDGKDLADEYLGSLYEQIVKNEIKMSGDFDAPQSKQANGLNKLLGIDGILNIVNWKQTEEKPLGANGLLIRHIQEQFKAKTGKSESVYHVVTDVAIIRFMIEVCWGPMLAAFSMTLDRSDDKLATEQCLLGFRYAVHVTSVMGMQTQRDAFVTSIAKFTFLHCVADMKQKNVDAVKAIISIAIVDGNYLQEAWEHILTCLSRIEQLLLLGEGAPSDASILAAAPISETDEKLGKGLQYPSLKKKGTVQNPAVVAVVRGSSYDSTTMAANYPGVVTLEQINNFISNLNLLDQIGSFELNHVFASSQRLNSEAIVAFVRALCKVAITELQSPTDPRVFSLTKLVEIAHYNMNRIRLVWSRIWGVLSDFFVSVGLSENLSVAIFVMDSLRQLSMKFLEREELANYNFQNEFLRPFAIVMQKSNSTEIRELIIRCISQMVLSRVSHVKSGWKSVLLVFTVAAADERKNIVLLAFETMEKIVREHFPYITETETTTFTDCVRCLITFTNSKFSSDISFNAIAFLRFCALKLAEGGLVGNPNSMTGPATDHNFDVQASSNKDDHSTFWVPLLTGLSNLSSDPRCAIRKSALEVLFNILSDHGLLFSKSFWAEILESIILPIFNNINKEELTWDVETSATAAHCLVDLFVRFFEVLKPQLDVVVCALSTYMKSPAQGPPSIGFAAYLRLISELGNEFSEEDWRRIILEMQEAATSSVPNVLTVWRSLDDIPMGDNLNDADADADADACSEGFGDDGIGEDHLQVAAYVVSRLKSHIATQLLILQIACDIYKAYKSMISTLNLKIILDTFCAITSHASQLSSDRILQKKMQRACAQLDVSDPPFIHFENESYQNYMNFLQELRVEKSIAYEGDSVEVLLVGTCEKVMRIYLKCTKPERDDPSVHWALPLGSAKKEELAARTSLLICALRILLTLDNHFFTHFLGNLYPLLLDLLRSDHCSAEVRFMLSNIFHFSIGPIVIQ